MLEENKKQRRNNNKNKIILRIEIWIQRKNIIIIYCILL